MAKVMKNKSVKRKHFKSRKRVLGEDNGALSIPDDEELKYLEKAVLGSGSDAFEQVPLEDSDDEEIPSKRKEIINKTPAWVDEDDNVTFQEVVDKQGRRCTPGVSGSKKYQDITEQKVKQVMGEPKWARVPKEKNLADDMLQTCGRFIKKPKFLKNCEIEFKTLYDLNCKTRSEGPFINVLKFHPKSTVAMVAGSSGIVSLFQVDGKENTKLQSLQFQKYPIMCGSFLKNGEEFLIGSQHHKYFYSHNLMTGQSTKVDNSKIINITNTKYFCVSPNDDIIAVRGNSGKIYLFAASTKEYIDCLQMNCKVTALDFNESGSRLYSHGEDGEVYLWDMNSRTCIKKFYDDGCIKGSSIAVSKNDQFLACGSNSGVVNFYSTEQIKSDDTIFPSKSIFNLVTPITNVKFNGSSEILAIASSHKPNAIKLFHCSSMTIFKNFPFVQSKLQRPLCMDFSPNGGFFAVGDNKGTAFLYRLKHYGNY